MLVVMTSGYARDHGITGGIFERPLVRGGCFPRMRPSLRTMTACRLDDLVVFAGTQFGK